MGGDCCGFKFLQSGVKKNVWFVSDWNLCFSNERDVGGVSLETLPRADRQRVKIATSSAQELLAISSETIRYLLVWWVWICSYTGESVIYSYEVTMSVIVVIRRKCIVSVTTSFSCTWFCCKNRWQEDCASEKEKSDAAAWCWKFDIRPLKLKIIYNRFLFVAASKVDSTENDISESHEKQLQGQESF